MMATVSICNVFQWSAIVQCSAWTEKQWQMTLLLFVLILLSPLKIWYNKIILRNNLNWTCSRILRQLLFLPLVLNSRKQTRAHWPGKEEGSSPVPTPHLGVCLVLSPDWGRMRDVIVTFRYLFVFNTIQNEQFRRPVVPIYFLSLRRISQSF